MTKTSEILVCPFLCQKKTIIIDRLQNVFTTVMAAASTFYALVAKRSWMEAFSMHG